MAAKSTKSKTTGKKTNTTAKKPSSNKKTTRKTTKRTTGKRKTAGRKSTGNGNSFLIDEILIWTTLAVSIILLISNFGIFMECLWRCSVCDPFYPVRTCIISDIE